jgi:hypothetical protein
MQQTLGSNEYDSEIQCNCYGMGVAYNKDFIIVTTITGTAKVMKVTDLGTPSIKYENFPRVFITSEPKIVPTFSCMCTCAFASKTIYSKLSLKVLLPDLGASLLCMIEAENLHIIV